MRTTKMLPWIARKAGVPQARAEELWAEAIRRATERTGWVGTPDYWKAAVDHLMALIEAEKLASMRPPEPVKSLAQVASPVDLMVHSTPRDTSLRSPEVA
jgi:hypothetical protein